MAVAEAGASEQGPPHRIMEPARGHRLDGARMRGEQPPRLDAPECGLGPDERPLGPEGVGELGAQLDPAGAAPLRPVADRPALRGRPAYPQHPGAKVEIIRPEGERLADPQARPRERQDERRVLRQLPARGLDQRLEVGPGEQVARVERRGGASAGEELAHSPARIAREPARLDGGHQARLQRDERRADRARLQRLAIGEERRHRGLDALRRDRGQRQRPERREPVVAEHLAVVLLRRGAAVDRDVIAEPVGGVGGEGWRRGGWRGEHAEIPDGKPRPELDGRRRRGALPDLPGAEALGLTDSAMVDEAVPLAGLLADLDAHRGPLAPEDRGPIG